MRGRRLPGTGAKAGTVQKEERHSRLPYNVLLFCRDHQSRANQGRRQAVTATVTRTGPSHSERKHTERHKAGL